jgi:hypothetical protein
MNPSYEKHIQAALNMLTLTGEFVLALGVAPRVAAQDAEHRLSRLLGCPVKVAIKRHGITWALLLK